MRLQTLIVGSLFLLLAGCKISHSDVKDGFKESEQVLRVAAAEEPTSFDPRLIRDLRPVTVMHLLYEGLMRINSHGKTENALAESVSHSSDFKTYIFKLRKAQWSNGDPVTAQDFVETWRTVLDPKFPAPNAYQFYVLKNAKKVKEGKVPLEELGVKAEDPATLIVELESPTPYFLDLVSTHFYYPVHSQSTHEKIISNGPFILRSQKQNNELLFAKNLKYWDAQEVHLDGIALYVLDDQTALRMYESGELDWAGSPMSTLPQDAIASLRHRHKLMVAPAAGTHWFRFNTEKEPFNNLQMRKAFTLSLNRHHIVEFVTKGYQKSAEAIVPPNFGLTKNSYFDDNAIPTAWYAFQEALEDMKISKDDLPEIVLSYAASDRNSKIAQAVQQQWKTALGIDVKLESMESKVFFDRLAQKNFQLSSGSWYADFRDPISFLDVFKSKNNSTNNTQWENEKYIELLNKSNKESDPLKRFHILDEAQGVLMNEYPVAPLFFGSFNYVKRDDLLGVYFSDLGYLDFKHAFFSR